MITLECNYSKKIGLPGYSSHQFSITLRSELSDVSQVQAESARLYTLLQHGVDTSIQHVGFLPGNNGNGHSNGHTNGNGNGRHTHQANGYSNGRGETWACTPKQRDLILNIVESNRLDKGEIEHLAQDRFGKGVRQLNKLEASGLIDELIDAHGQSLARRGYAKSGGRR